MSSFLWIAAATAATTTAAAVAATAAAAAAAIPSAPSARSATIAPSASSTPATPAPPAAKPARELRYTPDGTDFVIENGTGRFNRPLYGGHAGFRVEAGDQPEFALYLPGRGGVVRLALLAPEGAPEGLPKARWITECRHVVARYRPGSMVYEIRDPLLGDGILRLTALAVPAGDALLLRIEATERMAAPVGLLFAYGGANGDRGRRNGDLGGERMPLARFFQLDPAFCRDHHYTHRDDGFELRAKAGILQGVATKVRRIAGADAARWSDPTALLASVGASTPTPVVIGELAVEPGTPTYLAVQRVGEAGNRYAGAALPSLFEEAEQHRRTLATRLLVATPDAFIDAAAAALGVAADAIWDEARGVYLHGAVAWRIPLLGWRAAYAGDVLGWHERTRRHFSGFAAKQNTNPIPERMPPADAEFNLARNLAALRTNGDLASTEPHFYDMNLVAIDTFFRHLLWTGDLSYAAEQWPVLERHLAWERRLFRRPFGPERLPLYEAYACIWASDELAYHGGGATHASAYNYWHNTMAARVARLLGKEAAPYEREAAAILAAMNRELWLPERGNFAEFKDLLGRQSVHPSAALWTFYHTLDSQVPTPLQAWQMAAGTENELPKIPLVGARVPSGTFNTATTRWMPYRWSSNNVALAESAHGALAYWQAEHAEEAFALLKGAFLDSMYLGQCPGNVGMTTASDAHSGEVYRDFADAVGITSRALVEGLFGLRPDALAGELQVRPGLPREWERARLQNPNITFEYRRDGLQESYRIETKFAVPMRLRLQPHARRDRIVSVTVNGSEARWRPLPDEVGFPRYEILTSVGGVQEVIVRWGGERLAEDRPMRVCALGETVVLEAGAARPTEVADPQRALERVEIGERTVRGNAAGAPGQRTVFVRLRQGDMTWWEPCRMEVAERVSLRPSELQPPGQLCAHLHNGTARSIDGVVEISVAGRTESRRIALPARGATELRVEAQGLRPGSHRMSVRLPDGTKADCVVTHWKLGGVEGSGGRWDCVDLGAFFNARVADIFRVRYLSPRSPFCSLALPVQGIGGWCVFNDSAEIDDAGLRAEARAGNGVVTLPSGLPFRTPGEAAARNIVFTSQWDNYPREAAIPLSGRASAVCLLMAGSTNHMQSQFDNGEVVVGYADGTSERLPLHNPTNWWPIEQDYFVDGIAFARSGAIPPRLDLKTGKLRLLSSEELALKRGRIPGGSATVLDLPLDPTKPLRGLTVRTHANEVVIGLMAVTLRRETP